MPPRCINSDTVKRDRCAEKRGELYQLIKQLEFQLISTHFMQNVSLSAEKLNASYTVLYCNQRQEHKVGNLQSRRSTEKLKICPYKLSVTNNKESLRTVWQRKKQSGAFEAMKRRETKKK